MNPRDGVGYWGDYSTGESIQAMLDRVDETTWRVTCWGSLYLGMYCWINFYGGHPSNLHKTYNARPPCCFKINGNWDVDSQVQTSLCEFPDVTYADFDLECV
jgi:hypothetical protein